MAEEAQQDFPGSGDPQARAEELERRRAEDRFDISDPAEDEGEGEKADAAPESQANAADKPTAEDTTVGDDAPRAARNDGSAPDDKGARFDSDLLARAADAGLSAKEAEAFATPENLDRAVNVLESKIADIGREGGGKRTSEGKGDDADKAVKGEEKNEDGFRIDLDEDLFDPEVVRELNRMNEHYAGQMSGVRKQLDDALGKLKVQEDAAFEDRFDRMVNGLDREHQTLLGPEGGKNRRDLIDEMNAMAAGYRHMGRESPPERELFSKALRSVFGDQMQQIARKRINGQIRDRRGQFTSRPTHRQSSGDLSEYENAVKEVSERFKELTGSDG